MMRTCSFIISICIVRPLLQCPFFHFFRAAIFGQELWSLCARSLCSLC